MSVRQNTVRNPRCALNGVDYNISAGGDGGVLSGARMTDGALVIPETGQVINTYFRVTVTTAPATLFANTGILHGSGSIDSAVVVSGKGYTLSCYARSSHADRVAFLFSTIYNSAGVLISGNFTGLPVAVGGTTWKRLLLTIPAASMPIGAARIFSRIYANGSGTNWIVGDTLDATALLGETTETLGYYFDGDTVNTGTQIYTWLAGSSASQSALDLVKSNDGIMTDLIQKGYTTGSKSDRMMKQLTDLGFVTGSLADREYARLKAKTGASSSMSDLYALANEAPRL